jgi:hypothetical protein
MVATWFTGLSFLVPTPSIGLNQTWVALQTFPATIIGRLWRPRRTLAHSGGRSGGSGSVVTDLAAVRVATDVS